MFSRMAEIVLYPVHSVSVWLKNSDDLFPTYLRSRSELSKQVEDLKAKEATTSGTQLTINKLLDENIQLRTMLGVSTSTERVVGKVIAGPDSLAYDLLQINRGLDDGVKVGAPVYSGLDSVIGVVVHVASNYSFVELFTSPNFRSTAFVVGPNVFSILEGMGGGVARVRLSQGIDLREEQVVMLPGIFDGIYGEIVSIENHPTQPEQYGYVTPPIAMNSIYFVSIDKNVVKTKTTEEIKADVRDMVKKKTSLDRNIIDAINFAEGELAPDFDLVTTTASSSIEDVEEGVFNSTSSENF